MRGIIFSIDTIIALILAISILALFPLSFETSFPEISYQRLSYEAQDILNLLANLKVKDVENKTTIKNLLEKGVLKQEDLNKTLLDLIGSFWFGGNLSIAKNISREVLENLTKGTCFNLTVDNEVIYSSCSTPAKNIAVSYKITSGYEVGKPVSGYIARAWVTKIVKNTTEIIPFYPEGSGWGHPTRILEVSKKFLLPTNVTILNATLFVSIHFGTDKSQAVFTQLRVNGVQKKNDVVWLYLEESSVGGEVTTAAYGYVDVTKEIKAGENEISLEIGTPFYHSHIHPGMRLVVTYSLPQEIAGANKTFKKRYYFDNVEGETGAWAILSFFIPEKAKNANATLHLKIKGIEDSTYRGINTTDISIYINSGQPFYIDGVNDPENSLLYCKRIRYYYCERDLSASRDVDLTFNITNRLINGTNVVAVYFNSYSDYHWGDEDAEIYSDPIDDPNNSSYVEVYYELEEAPFGYGEIDLTKEVLFGGEAENPKTFSFNLTEARSRIIESFTHIAQGFSSMLEVNATFNGLPWKKVFVSPAVRAVPEAAYIPPTIWSVGLNYIKMRDFQPGGSTSPGNYILPWTSFEYTYLVKGLVGYGSVFNSSQLAIEDAKNRLITQIGAEGINATDIQVDSKSVAGIRWLWGPSLFKIIAWSS
jgi:hypothetical protein